MKYNIYAGLSQPFGGAIYRGTVDCNIEEAEYLAYDLACQEYNKYGKSNGLLTTKQAEQIAIADGCDPDTSEFLVYIDELFTQDMQDHISYYIIPTSEDTKVKEIKELKY